MYNGGWIVFMMPTEKTYRLLHVYKKYIVWKAFNATIYEISLVFSRTIVIHSMVLITNVWIKIPLINNGTIFHKLTKKNIEFLKYEYPFNPENPCFQYHYSTWVVLKNVKLEWKLSSILNIYWLSKTYHMLYMIYTSFHIFSECRIDNVQSNNSINIP